MAAVATELRFFVDESLMGLGKALSAQRVRPFSAAYSTSKHGLWGLTQVTAQEGRDALLQRGRIPPVTMNVATVW